MRAIKAMTTSASAMASGSGKPPSFVALALVDVAEHQVAAVDPISSPSHDAALACPP
jgi:hypothetical protein